jgi:uncharacterized small protein (DUF1192 family)
MKVDFVTENEDGSADIMLNDISAEELRVLVQEGLISILKREIDRLDDEQKNKDVKE